MNFNEWCNTVPEDIRGDSLWKMDAYRLSLFAAEIGWQDVSKLAGDNRTNAISTQLYRALGSIHTNIEEGYSRGTGRDRARFYEYSLGSARESRDWYYDGRHILGETVASHRMNFLTQIIRLLLTMVPEQRYGTVREEPLPYRTDYDDPLSNTPCSRWGKYLRPNHVSLITFHHHATRHRHR